VSDADMAQTFFTVMGVTATITMIAIVAYLVVWVARNRRHDA
jgi:phage shock protein PspC (stress-responsive transcriptional regulator)